MALSPAVDTLWNELQTVREKVLKETEGLSQGQADWRPSDTDWSVGEILHHLTLAEINTGKLTSKLIKEADAAGKLAPPPPGPKGVRPPPPPTPRATRG